MHQKKFINLKNIKFLIYSTKSIRSIFIQHLFEYLLKENQLIDEELPSFQLAFKTLNSSHLFDCVGTTKQQLSEFESKWQNMIIGTCQETDDKCEQLFQDVSFRSLYPKKAQS